MTRWGYRNSTWYQIAGEDYLFEAFKAARAADPDAQLLYNDFWNYLDGKRDFIISFVQRLQNENLIDGVGFQCHLNIIPVQEKMSNQSVYQTVENLEKEIQEYAALGKIYNPTLRRRIFSCQATHRAIPQEELTFDVIGARR